MLKAILFVVVLGICPAALAADMVGLYTGVVTVPDQSSQARSAGVRAALAQVLVRASGMTSVSGTAAGGVILDNAANMLQRYSYQEVAGHKDASGNVANHYQLHVRFDPRRVDQALQQHNLPVWGNQRPRTMIWASVENGGTHLLSTHAGASGALRNAARKRGIAMLLPDANGRVSVVDVLQSNDKRLLPVTRQHGAQNMLIGRISQSGNWQASWTLTTGTTVLANWYDSAPSLANLLTHATNTVADRYAQRYAVRSDGLVASMVAAFQPVDSAADYARVSNYLAAVNGVKSVAPVLVRNNIVVFRLQVDASPGVVARSIALADWLSRDGGMRNIAALFANDGQALGFRVGQLQPSG